MKVSNHAKKRMLERCCFPSDLQTRMENVEKYGVCARDLRKGSSLYKCLRERERKNCRAVIYDGYVYIFSTDDDTLITLYPVKKRHKKSY